MHYQKVICVFSERCARYGCKKCEAEACQLNEKLQHGVTLQFSNINSSISNQSNIKYKNMIPK